MIALNQLLLNKPEELLADDPTRTAAERLYLLWLNDRKSATTQRTYASALQAFADFLGEPSIPAAIAKCLKAGKGSTIACLQAWLAVMSKSLAPHTCNLRIAAVRSVLQAGYQLDMISWSIRFRGLKAGNVKNCAGPSLDQIRAMYATIEGNNSRAKRDRAIFLLLWSLALRRSELTGLDMEHVDLAKNCIAVLGKGRLVRDWLTIPPAATAALAAWVEARGDWSGPLFVPVSRGTGERLGDHSVYLLCREWGRRVGIDNLHPHKIRHSALTALIARTGDVTKVRMLSRHAGLDVLLRYRDSLSDEAGGLAGMLAGMLD